MARKHNDILNVALIGYGYWGTNVAREIQLRNDVVLSTIFDIDPMQRRKAKMRFPSLKMFDSYRDVLKSGVDAVFIVTPPETHYTLARQALGAGKHLFVEKPITTKLSHAYDLVELAETKNLVLFADHVFIHSEPVKYLKSLIQKKELGDIVYINARRINLGLFQHKVDVIWDLAIHDISIIDYLIGFDVKKMSVFKKKYKDFPNDAIANINCDLKNGTTVGINVSWLSPVKVREMIIGGTKKMAVYDETQARRIAIYDHGVVLKDNLDRDTLYQKLVSYKIGKVNKPRLPKGDALANAVGDFVECIHEGRQPITGKQSIINTIQALEMISKV